MNKIFSQGAILVRAAEVADCDLLSEIHADAFRRGWSEAEFEALLVQEGVHALVAEHGRWGRRRKAAGFILFRIVADEAEILSVAVAQACRRRGIARALMEEALRHLYREHVRVLHLEVEDGNSAALGLYAAFRFEEAGRRQNYYQQPGGERRGALLMRLALR